MYTFITILNTLDIVTNSMQHKMVFLDRYYTIHVSHQLLELIAIELPILKYLKKQTENMFKIIMQQNLRISKQNNLT